MQPFVLRRSAETPAYIECMHSELTLHSIPDDELIRRLHELVAHSRGTEADLVAHIGEVDERKLYARSAFPSMFVYCTQVLHLSEAEAYRRITVARAARKHAVLLEMLRDGRIHMSGMAVLVPVLTPENRDAVLERATHKSKRQIEQLVAELAPKPDVRSLMRKLPGPRQTLPLGAAIGGDSGFGRTLEFVPGTAGAREMATAAPQWQGQGTIEVDHAYGGVELVPGTVGTPGSTASRRATVEPLSPGRYKVQFTASAELHDQLERLAALMRSEVPDGDIAAIIQRAVAEKLERAPARA
jgi:hypothetical protein